MAIVYDPSESDLFALVSRLSLSRRRFIQVSAGSFAASLIPFDRAAARNDQWYPVIAYVGRLAVAIGTPVLADLISDYIRTRSPWLRRQITDVNNKMIQDKFTDFSAARVRGKEGHFFYPVIHEDRFNACAGFFNNHADGQNVAAVIEGPTLIGLSLAAQEMRRSTSAGYTYAALNPETVVSRSVGEFQSTYEQPDIYRTQVGEVRMTYRNEGPGRGTIAVLASRQLNSSRWSTLLAREYPIQYVA